MDDQKKNQTNKMDLTDKMGLAEEFGKILKVDLFSEKCSFFAFPEDGVSYLGGRGFNVWYLYHHLPHYTDPLSWENILMFSCGLLTGSSAPASSRLHLNALSPLTGILGSSNIGGYAGVWLRSCNIASVIITGRSEKPVYLYINPTGACLVDASHLWGCDTFKTQDLLKLSHENERIRILTIGQKKGPWMNLEQGVRSISNQLKQREN